MNQYLKYYAKFNLFFMVSHKKLIQNLMTLSGYFKDNFPKFTNRKNKKLRKRFKKLKFIININNKI